MNADSFSNKIPPQSLEAEQVVLGAMLTENKCISEVQKILSDGSFYSDSHRKMFLAIIDAFKKNGSVDLIILSDELKQRKQLDQVGGAAYIASLVDNLASAVLVGHHAGIVKRKDILRQTIIACLELAALAYEERESSEMIFAKWQSSLSELLKQSAPAEATQKLGMPLGEMRSYFASCRETPFESLNNAYGGFFPGELIVCGACPGTGKSAMAHAIMRHLSIQEGWPVFYFGAEMTAQKIYVRQLAALCKIPENDIKRGRTSGKQAESLLDAEQKINAALIGEHIIKDKINAIDLMSRVRKFADETGKEIGLVIVENLQQITWPGKKDKDEIDAVLSALRAFGIEMKIPIYLSSQIKRPDAGKESERPTLDELKGSGNIEEIADKVFLLYRPGYRPQAQTKNYASTSEGEEAEAIIAKGGPPIILPFKFFGPCLYWEEAREA